VSSKVLCYVDVLPHQRLWTSDVLVCPLSATESFLAAPLPSHVTLAPSLSPSSSVVLITSLLTFLSRFLTIFSHLHSASAVTRQFGHRPIPVIVIILTLYGHYTTSCHESTTLLFCRHFSPSYSSPKARDPGHVKSESGAHAPGTRAYNEGLCPPCSGVQRQNLGTGDQGTKLPPL